MDDLSLIYVNARGDEMDLINNDYFYLTDLQGVTLYNSTIASSIVGGVDGDTVGNIQAQPRVVIMTLQMKENVNVELAKRYILKHVKAKQEARLFWTQEQRPLVLTFVVESIEMPRFQNGVIMQIGLHAGQPYWEDIQNAIQTIDQVIRLHYFTTNIYDMLYFPVAGIPFGEIDQLRTRAIYNAGDVAVGMTITIKAMSTITNPLMTNAEGQYFGIGHVDDPVQMVEGDIAIITTGRGNKSATINDVSVMDKIRPSSTWLQLETGDNTFSIAAEEGAAANMYFSINYKQRYV